MHNIDQSHNKCINVVSIVYTAHSWPLLLLFFVCFRPRSFWTSWCTVHCTLMYRYTVPTKFWFAAYKLSLSQLQQMQRHIFGFCARHIPLYLLIRDRLSFYAEIQIILGKVWSYIGGWGEWGVYSVLGGINIKSELLKGTVQREFLPLVFFFIRTSLGHWPMSYNIFEFGFVFDDIFQNLV